MAKDRRDALIEARIADARKRGLFDDLPQKGKPLPKDPLASLPAEERSKARITRALGVAPDEVRMMDQIEALKRELADCDDEAKRAELRRALRDRRIELRLLLERTGRAHLAGRV